MCKELTTDDILIAVFGEEKIKEIEEEVRKSIESGEIDDDEGEAEDNFGD